MVIAVCCHCYCSEETTWTYFRFLRGYKIPRLSLSGSDHWHGWLCWDLVAVKVNYTKLSFPFPKPLRILSAWSLSTNLRLFFCCSYLREKYLVYKGGPKCHESQATEGLSCQDKIIRCTLNVSLLTSYKKKGILKTLLYMSPDNCCSLKYTNIPQSFDVVSPPLMTKAL